MPLPGISARSPLGYAPSRSAGEAAAGRRALVILNRRSRSGADLIAEVGALLRARGLVVDAHAPRDCRQIREIIRARAHERDIIILGGGDGTLHGVLEEVVASGLPLGVLPLGTANDLARTLGLPTSLEQACDVIARGHRVKIDLGWVNGKLFLNAANIGLGVAVTARLTGASKRRWGVLGYAVATIDALRATRPFAAKVTSDGQARVLRSIQVAVGNGRYHGGGLTLAADASIDDSRLDLYSLRPMGLWQLLALVPALRRGEQYRWEQVDTASGEEIEIRTRRRLRVVADGEPVAWTPARFRVVPRALPVIVPAPPARAEEGDRMLRDEALVAVDRVALTSRGAAVAYADAASLADHGDLSALFADLARERDHMAAGLVPHIHALGGNPSDINPERALVGKAARRVRSALSADEHLALIRDRASEEDELAACIAAALAHDLPADTQRQLEHDARQVAAAQVRLARARAAIAGP